MTRSLLTSTMLGTILSCMRKYFYRYELGLQSSAEHAALSFGSAWHAAMAARWLGLPMSAALATALGNAEKLDDLQAATLAALLAAYYRHYANDPITAIRPEQEFQFPLAGSRSFLVAGKMDGLGSLRDGRPVLLEHKTTSDSVAPDSDYWLRLRCNNQIMQYVHAARFCGQPVDVIYYDVTRKPAIRPKTIPILDEAGRRVVLDANGNRALRKDGAPRETGGEGLCVQTREEAPEEFGDRLAADASERPEFYFARREVPILDQDLEEFEAERLSTSRLILDLRQSSRFTRMPHHAWPRTCSESTCGSCEFKNFCLQNIVVDPAQPPAGFTVGEKYPELSAANKGG